MSPDYGLTIAESFQKYLKTGNTRLIENYSARQLKTAISRLSPYYDNNKKWYREIERRITELSSVESIHRTQNNEGLKRAWLNPAIYIALGFLIGLFVK